MPAAHPAEFDRRAVAFARAKEKPIARRSLLASAVTHSSTK